MEQTNHAIDFHILDCGIFKRTQTILQEYIAKYPRARIYFHTIPLHDIQDFQTPLYFSTAIYARFYIAELVPEIEKAIYIDIDTYVIGDIADIFTYNLGEYGLGAVSGDADNIFLDQHTFLTKYKDSIGLAKEDYYFISGLLLINCTYWRTHSVLKQCLDIMKKNKNLSYPDQDALNLLFRQKYTSLPPHFQYFVNETTERYRTYIEEHIKEKHCVIMHFTTHKKPWNTPIEELGFSQTWWKYAKLTPFYTEFSLELMELQIKKLVRYNEITLYKKVKAYLKYKTSWGEQRKKYKQLYHEMIS